MEASQSETLDGWKQIAAYLGCSVRSAQRWEDEADLPVHRIATPGGGQIVYATRADLEAWRRHADAPRAGEVDAETRGDLNTTSFASQGDPTSPRTVAVVPAGMAIAPRRTGATFTHRHTTLASAAAVLGMVLGAALFLGLTASVVIVPRWSAAQTYELHGRWLVAVTASGRSVWSHDLGEGARFPNAITGPTDRVSPLVGNLEAGDDGDGSHVVAVPLTYSTTRQPSDRSDAVLVLDARGHRRWTIQPEPRIRLGRETFDGPWQVNAMAFSTASPHRLWVAYSDIDDEAGFVMEVTADGRASIRYAFGGRAFALAHWRTRDGNYLAVGGHDRLDQAPAVTILDLDRPGARWPSRDDQLPCDQCPMAAPRLIALFPTSEVATTLSRSNGTVFGLTTVDGRLVVDLTDGTGLAARHAVAIVDQALNVVRFEYSAKHWVTHRALEVEGRLRHTVDACPEAHNATPVRMWTSAAGWRQRFVAPSPSPPRHMTTWRSDSR
jgi:hypothetical protein